MSIPIKTPEEIAIMTEGGKILANILQELKKTAKPGIQTIELDNLAKQLMEKHSVQASFKNYRGFPAYICTAVNEEVVHSIPGERILQVGDIISIDCGIIYKNLHVDSAVIATMEPIKPEIKKFIRVVEQALTNALSIAKPGARVGDISFTIEQTVKKQGYCPVHELTGHGVGRQLHEPPQIPNYGQKGTGPALIPGMTLAIEPIINMGQRYIETLSDKWTIITKDRLPSAQIEHTIVITKEGNRILTAS